MMVGLCLLNENNYLHKVDPHFLHLFWYKARKHLYYLGKFKINLKSYDWTQVLWQIKLKIFQKKVELIDFCSEHENILEMAFINLIFIFLFRVCLKQKVLYKTVNQLKVGPPQKKSGCQILKRKQKYTLYHLSGTKHPFK